MNSYYFNTEQPTILIVDDVPDNLRVLSSTLTEQGYQVRCAKNGSMALIGVQADRPDLILLDIKMPDMNGYEVCQKLKASPVTRDIPVIFMSALDDVFDKVRAFDVGGVDYITKPFQVGEVLARVKSQLALQAAKAEIYKLNAELEQRVQQRTAELQIVNQKLQREITERKRAEEQLIHDALHDALTGLPNRTLFMERVNSALKEAKRRTNYLFAVLFIDLNRFKIINDSLGHSVGDQLLIAFAQLLKQCLRTTDTIARLGGDEFTILLEDIKDITDATSIAERLQEKLMSPFNLESHTVFTSASIGIALSSTGYEQAAGLLRDADIAMYRGKEQGTTARYAIFDQVMYEQTLESLHLESELRQALECQEFCLHYQPITSLVTGRLTGFEALVRWQHPDRGLISPTKFIPVAEETGLIISLGEWVLREACRQLRAWQVKFPTVQLKISVNIAGKQIREPNFIKQIDRILAETGLDGSYLKLEITETMLMEYAEETINMLSQIRARKIQLSIDDFGQGYSSLSYLRRFPIDTLKIDRSFVSGMNSDHENFEIVRTITTLAHTLGMNVIAEGVEIIEQFAQLRALGCEFAQGYFFSKPLNCASAETMIVANPQWGVAQLEDEFSSNRVGSAHPSTPLAS